jgi:hypothetical protein
MTIEERFAVAAPPDRVWAMITDPGKMMPCRPRLRVDRGHESHPIQGQGGGEGGADADAFA